MPHAIRVVLVMVTLVWPIGQPARAEVDGLPDPPTTQWSYKILHLYDVFETDFVYRDREEENHLLEEHLNRLGAEGWELVAMEGSVLIFKRPH